MNQRISISENHPLGKPMYQMNLRHERSSRESRIPECEIFGQLPNRCWNHHQRIEKTRIGSGIDGDIPGLQPDADEDVDGFNTLSDGMEGKLMQAAECLRSLIDSGGRL